MPPDVIKEFAASLQRYNLINEIIGVENEEIRVDVYYTDSQQKNINSLHKTLSRYHDRKANAAEATEVEAFQVPASFILVVAEVVTKYKLKNSIAGVWQTDTGNWIIILVITYAKVQQWLIDAIANRIQKYESDQKDNRWRLNGVRRKS